MSATAPSTSTQTPKPADLDPAHLEAQLEEVQSLVDALQGEIELLRRRDEQIQFQIGQMDEEMRLAAKLQRDFLPKKLPQVDCVSSHVLFRPAGYVSGDFYDAMRLDEHHIGLYLADAVGHGTPAALLTMFMKNALLTKRIQGKHYELVPTSETMCRLNDTLIEQNLTLSCFATAVFGRLDCRTLEFVFSRGGHPFPIRISADGDIQHLESDGGLLGIMPEETFPEARIQLEPGDRLILYSDGVEVAFADDGIGDMRHWYKFIEEQRYRSAEQILEAVDAKLAQTTGSLAAKDDLTVLAIEVAG
ncbi:MAG: SpoIIE family protein phosphatase [Planctomycetota bacterium]